jgi:hypothetical protein
MRLTLAEIFNEWQGEWLTAAFLLISMVILTVLIQFKIIIILNLIYDQTEEYSTVPIYPMTFAKLILSQILMIIQLIIVQCLWILAFALGKDRTQESQIITLDLRILHFEIIII